MSSRLPAQKPLQALRVAFTEPLFHLAAELVEPSKSVPNWPLSRRLGVSEGAESSLMRQRIGVVRGADTYPSIASNS